MNLIYNFLGVRVAPREIVIGQTTRGQIIIRKNPEEYEVQQILKRGIEIIDIPEHFTVPSGCACV